MFLNYSQKKNTFKIIFMPHMNHSFVESLTGSSLAFETQILTRRTKIFPESLFRPISTNCRSRTHVQHAINCSAMATQQSGQRIQKKITFMAKIKLAEKQQKRPRRRRKIRYQGRLAMLLLLLLQRNGR